MKFIIDAHLPPDLARWLSEEVGHDAKHVADIGLRDSEDTPIWRYAIDQSTIRRLLLVKMRILRYVSNRPRMGRLWFGCVLATARERL